MDCGCMNDRFAYFIQEKDDGFGRETFVKALDLNTWDLIDGACSSDLKNGIKTTTFKK